MQQWPWIQLLDLIFSCEISSSHNVMTVLRTPWGGNYSIRTSTYSSLLRIKLRCKEYFLKKWVLSADQDIPWLYATRKYITVSIKHCYRIIHIWTNYTIFFQDICNIISPHTPRYHKRTGSFIEVFRPHFVVYFSLLPCMLLFYKECLKWKCRYACSCTCDTCVWDKRVMQLNHTTFAVYLCYVNTTLQAATSDIQHRNTQYREALILRHASHKQYLQVLY